ncbi:MAG: UDP-glucose/GDP-mannose dehydrogenase family protein [candidate division WOR-3 bacterium]|nr:MAG: UDP-glucose/GDP-mannose dehydrogenase family protein [candidate division WOR-3 bacterium]
MNISVFGLGYVGCVSLGCLAQDGHTVIGVDTNREKVRLINLGKATIIEAKIDKIIDEQHRQNKIRATNDYRDAVLESDVSIVCVGTPATEHGRLNLDYIFNVATQIGCVLKEKSSYHVVVIRSTVPPGTNASVGEIIEQTSERKKNKGFSVISNPEFMREGSAVDDYYEPAMIVIGGDNDRASKMVKQLYKNIDAPIVETSIEVAEIIKYVNNSFHALKIAFANEIGNICKKLNIDSHEVMDVFCKDDKLNISPSYFKPGFAFGGSCLPKDLEALRTLARDNYLSSPVLEAIKMSNENQKEIAYKIIESKGLRNIGMIGLSFKPGTDDLRFSPTVELVEKLIGKGYHLRIYDSNVYISKLTGTNRAYIEKHIPHLSQLITDNLSEVIRESEVLVVSHDHGDLRKVLKAHTKKIVVDLVRISGYWLWKNYEGICW